MTKKDKSEGRLVLAIILSTMLALVGAFYIYSGFSQAVEEMSAEYSDHLLDTARSIDKNADTMFTNTREQLRLMVSACTEAGETFFITNDSSDLIKAMSSHHALTPSYVVGAVFVFRESVILSSDGAAPGNYTFPYGINTNPCICTDIVGKKYLAIVENCMDADYRYALLIDPAKFYMECGLTELSNKYWLTFYAMDSGIFMQNGNEPKLEFLPYAEAVKSGGGLSVLASSEADGKLTMRRFKYGEYGENLMVVLPSGSNLNGVFAVGLAQPTSGFMEILSRVLMCILMGGVLVLLSISALLLLFIDNRRSNAVMREKVALLEKENQAMQEVAHHQRLEMIGTMTGSLAHEFNNMLTPIMGYSIMTMEQLPEGCDDLMDNLSEILESAEKAKGLIARMSSLTRKNTDASNKLFSPDALVQKVCHFTAPSIPAKVDVKLDCRCPDEKLFANETQITQLLMNIVINAFQAMEEKGGTLTISTRREDENIVFSLTDTGPGIPENILSRMFEPFFTTKEVGRGTGLGLAIASQIVENHNGSIRAESKPGEGSVFIVTLPVSQEEENVSGRE